MYFGLTRDTLRQCREMEDHPLLSDVTETQESIFSWGCRLFTIAEQSCLQAVHADSRLHVFLYGLSPIHMPDLGEYLLELLIRMYRTDAPMCAALERYAEASSVSHFFRLTERRLIRRMTSASRTAALDAILCYGQGRNYDDGTAMANAIYNQMIYYRDYEGRHRRVTPMAEFRELLLRRWG